MTFVMARSYDDTIWHLQESKGKSTQIVLILWQKYHALNIRLSPNPDVPKIMASSLIQISSRTISQNQFLVSPIAGVCKGRFNTVFDWLRKGENGQFIYNTYFFRGNHYWMYENHANRTRYGDPLYISREWLGIPNEPDGYAHVFFYNGVNVVNDAYFFKGTLRWCMYMHG